MREISDIFTDEQGGIYSADGKVLLKAPNINRYLIREGTERVAAGAFYGCTELQRIGFPCSCPEEAVPDDAFPVYNELDEDCPYQFGLLHFCSVPYEDENLVDEPEWREEDDIVFDDFGVAYTKNYKRLLYSTKQLPEGEYKVPEGVLTICSFAFIYQEKRIELSLPRTIKVIGCGILNKNGGKMVFRD